MWHDYRYCPVNVHTTVYMYCLFIDVTVPVTDIGSPPGPQKRTYSTRSQSKAPAFSKRLGKGDSILASGFDMD